MKKVKADSKSDYKDMLDTVGEEAGLSTEEKDIFQEMYVGAKKQSNQRQAKNTSMELPKVENPPTYSVNFDFADEGYDSDVTSKEFFVDQSELETPGLKKMKEVQRNMVNPAGTPPTAPRQDADKDVEASKKDKARQAQLVLASAKNLTSLLHSKGLIQQEKMTEYVKQIVSLDNKAFTLLSKIAMEFKGQGTTKTASTSVGLKDIPHTSKPVLRGQTLNDLMETAPWTGVPQAGYNHKEHSNG